LDRIADVGVPMSENPKIIIRVISDAFLSHKAVK